MQKKFYIFLIGWSITIAGLLLFDLYLVNKDYNDVLQDKSKNTVDLLAGMGLWNSVHQKVYIPTSPAIRPNPYLVHPKRDVITTQGDTLTMINPAFFIRQIAGLTHSPGDHFHLTSLSPIRPANKPDGWETKALKTFTESDDEYFELINNDTICRYMVPLTMNPSCLQCHASQGYKAGDIYGGISVTTLAGPDNTIAPAIKRTVIIYGIIFIAGFFLLIYFLRSVKECNASNESKIDQLKKMNNAQNDLLNIVAHDLKTLASNIVFLAGTLKGKISEMSTDETHEYIDMLSESANTNYDLLINLLDWSRMQSNRIAINVEQLDMNLLVNNVFKQTQFQAQQKNIEQVNMVSNSVVWADSNVVTAIIRNLVVNAIKYTYPGGKVIVRSSFKDDQMMISVEDTGVGISKERVARLFDIDRNKSTTGTVNEPGTGLGLILCKGLVERSGGRIWVESEPDKGSVFYFTLPSTPQQTC